MLGASVQQQSRGFGGTFKARGPPAGFVVLHVSRCQDVPGGALAELAMLAIALAVVLAALPVALAGLPVALAVALAAIAIVLAVAL